MSNMNEISKIESVAINPTEVPVVRTEPSEMLLPKEPFQEGDGSTESTRVEGVGVSNNDNNNVEAVPEVVVKPMSFLGFPVSEDVLPASIVNDKANGRTLPVAA